MKNSIVDLRNHLFATLEALQDKDEPMDIERAKTIALVSGKLIDSAKVEVQYLEVTGQRGSSFIPEVPALENKPGTTTHLLK